MEILPQSFHGALDNANFVALRRPQISEFDKLGDHLGGGNGPAKLNDDPHTMPRPARDHESALNQYHILAISDQRQGQSRGDWKRAIGAA
jgi:hypothetical protein